MTGLQRSDAVTEKNGIKIFLQGQGQNYSRTIDFQVDAVFITKLV
jgi:hypothetical protein